MADNVTTFHIAYNACMHMAETLSDQQIQGGLQSRQKLCTQYATECLLAHPATHPGKSLRQHRAGSRSITGRSFTGWAQSLPLKGLQGSCAGALPRQSGRTLHQRRRSVGRIREVQPCMEAASSHQHMMLPWMRGAWDLLLMTELSSPSARREKFSTDLIFWPMSTMEQARGLRHLAGKHAL